MILIGNEILSGKIQDSNLNFLSKELYHRGVDMVRAEVIPDEVEVIVDTIHRLKKVVGDDGVIFTSGGIGPTHDDKTYEAVAQAFGRYIHVYALSRCQFVKGVSRTGLYKSVPGFVYVHMYTTYIDT